MKYKVGDKVRIKSIDWYNANKDTTGSVNSLIYPMAEYCGKEAIIISVINDIYIIDIDNGNWCWTDDLFDENFKDMEVKKIVIPEGWEVDKVENGEIILKESKKELPKTWEECYIKLGKGEHIDTYCNVSNKVTLLYPKDTNRNVLPVGLAEPMLALYMLLVCREIYRNGWKPNWDSKENKYCIEYYYNDDITCSIYKHNAHTLSFQSEEICNQFLENFRDLIKEAKELI